ncbi:MAG: beta-lactamase family protein [Acidobacteriota bacterium]|nr:beta-lactamase family protein [Acidobacteriota bacterium]
MKHPLLAATVFALVALNCRAADTAPLDTAAVDRYLTRAVPFGFSGAVAVVDGGKIVFARGYGFADRANKVPFTDETFFDVGSIVKTFTGTAIHQLIEQKKISLDDTLARFFPDVPEDKKNITIAQILTHTAGLPTYSGEDYELVNREEMVRRTFAAKLTSTPGTKWAYSNTGYSVLAVLVEKLTGESFEAYVNEHLMKPSGLAHTGYTIPSWFGRTIAHGYRKGVDDGTPLDKAWFGDGPSWTLRGNGGFLSNVNELARWAIAFRGTSLLSAETLARALEPRIDTGRTAGEQMAYGWFFEQAPQGRLVSHSGGNPYFGTNLRRYIDRDVAIVFTTNDVSANMNPYEKNVAALLFGATNIALPPEVTANVDLAKFAGHYRLPSGRELELRFTNGQLVVDPKAAAEVVALVRPAGALTTPRAQEVERAAKAAFTGVGKGDLAPLLATLVADAPPQGEKDFWAEWLTERQKELGAFVSATPLWTLQSKDELHTTVFMQFQKGAEIVRWEQRPNGTYAQAFPPRRLPLLYGLAAASPAELVVWNPLLGASARIRVDGGALVFDGVRAEPMR